jgi:hypothetical protein
MSSSFHGLPTGSLVNRYLRLEYLQEAGPRIVLLSLLDGNGEPGLNVMADVHDVGIPTPYGTFRLYGGHRLWHSPEAMPRSYVPDNEGCGVEKTENGAVLTGCVEAPTGIRKTIRLDVAPDRAAVTVTHVLENSGVWPVELAAWALSQLRLGGIAVFPQTVGKLDAPGLLPNRNLVLWPYTRLSDSRLSLNDDFDLIRADADPHAVKIGYLNRAGWAAYLLEDVLFVKRWTPQPDARHVDFGCNCESYCNHQFIEVETVGPLVTLEPGQLLTHVEEWELYRIQPAQKTLEGVKPVLKQVGLI